MRTILFTAAVLAFGVSAAQAGNLALLSQSGFGNASFGIQAGNGTNFSDTKQSGFLNTSLAVQLNFKGVNTLQVNQKNGLNNSFASQIAI